MKSRAAVLSKVVMSTTAIFIAGTGAFAQVGGNPYDTGSSNPFLKNKTPSPAPSAAAAAPAAAKLSAKDNKFLVSALSSGGWEVKTGTAVESKLQGAAKDVAARLVSDHTKTNAELVALAKKKGLAISADNIKGQQIPGPNYDKNYLTLVGQDYEQSIPAFQKAAASSDDPEVKAYAARTLPALRQQSALVKSAQSKAK